VKRIIGDSYGTYDRMTMEHSLHSDEAREGWLAFSEKRSPSWVPSELRTEGRI
jgi:hypothetical protein